jgi:hypothetical protein
LLSWCVCGGGGGVLIVCRANITNSFLHVNDISKQLNCCLTCKQFHTKALNQFCSFFSPWRNIEIIDLTRDLLVFTGKSLLLVAGLVQLVVDALQLGLLVAQVTQGGLVGDGGLVQLGLEVQAEAVQLLDALLQIAGGVVGLRGKSQNCVKICNSQLKENFELPFLLSNKVCKFDTNFINLFGCNKKSAHLYGFTNTLPT